MILFLFLYLEKMGLLKSNSQTFSSFSFFSFFFFFYFCLWRKCYCLEAIPSHKFGGLYEAEPPPAQYKALVMWNRTEKQKQRCGESNQWLFATWIVDKVLATGGNLRWDFLYVLSTCIQYHACCRNYLATELISLEIMTRRLISL